MHYMVSYEISPETRNKAQERFKAGGGLPPDGVTMVARWHYPSGRGGWFGDRGAPKISYRPVGSASTPCHAEGCTVGSCSLSPSYCAEH